MSNEAGRWAISNLPNEWEWQKFKQVFKNVTSSKKKLKATEYKATGRFPVIDQGQDFFGGWTDDDSLVLDVEPPVVVFGDHTRCVKFVEQPFVQGADGVKVFETKPHILPRYGYWLLRSIQLPDKGYSRHFKFLKASEFPVPSVEIQSRIVQRLDSAVLSLQSVGRNLAPVPDLIAKFRQSVLAAAFRGDLTKEWREQNPDVEPASVLLERIRAERRERYIEDYAEQRRAKAEAKARKAGKPWGDEDDEKALDKARKKAAKRYKGAEPVDTAGLPELPTTWCWVSHDELLVSITAGKSPKAQGRPAEEGESGVLKQSAVSWGEFDPDENKALFGEIPDGVATVAKDDLLISRANTVELVGAVVLVRQEFPNLMLSDKTLRLDLVTSIDRTFLLHALRGEKVRAFFEDQATGTSDSMRNLSQPKIRAAPVPLLPLEEQRVIGEKIAELMARVQSASRETANVSDALESLASAVLASAFERAR